MTWGGGFKANSFIFEKEDPKMYMKQKKTGGAPDDEDAEMDMPSG